MTRRTIGHPDAELALLGALLHMPAAAALDVAQRMQGEDLVEPRNRAVLAAVAVVASQGLDPEPVLVDGSLRRLGLEQCFTDDRAAGAYLADVYTAAAVPASVEHYLRIVLEHAYRRRVVEAAARLEQHAGVMGLDELQALVDVEVTAMRTAASRARLPARPGPSVQAAA